MRVREGDLRSQMRNVSRYSISEGSIRERESGCEGENERVRGKW